MAYINGNDDFIIAFQGVASFEQIYPVGSIYISTKDGEAYDPANLFGGTWVLIEQRFLLGAGGSYTLGAKGGSTSHSHGAGTLGATVTMTGSSILISSIQQKDGLNYTPTAKINASSRDTYSNQTDYIVPVLGNTASTNHMPPYQVVYIWERTAL